MKIVNSLLLSSVVIFNITSTGCTNELPKEIFKHWIHSHEEDTADVKVFRPSNYKFPPARGRFGFEIKENGEFIQYRIGPTDRPEKASGLWKAEGKDKILVYLEGKETPSYTINIVSCAEELLKIKK